jgi:hypothetical protein
MRFQGARLQPNPIIDSVAESLLAAQVAFSRLYRNVSQQKLNLFQFPASLMAQTGACPTIMPHAALEALCRMSNYAEPKLQFCECAVTRDPSG